MDKTYTSDIILSFIFLAISIIYFISYMVSVAGDKTNLDYLILCMLFYLTCREVATTITLDRILRRK